VVVPLLTLRLLAQLLEYKVVTLYSIPSLQLVVVVVAGFRIPVVTVVLEVVKELLAGPRL